ncbi:glycosyltransferase family 2 protein [Candidatus Sumerlaeota bacterium]|nr:glycosyltransferase family 2 protein [Candidatus Sumerlaeota bacterium]
MPPIASPSRGKPEAASPIEASLVIVNYRSERHTLRLLEHLLSPGAERPAQVIVIDNSPDEGLAAERVLEGDGVKYVAAERNIGFAAAVNRGIARAAHECILLLNPDTLPETGCLAGLVRELESDPSVAVAAPRLVPFDDSLPPVPSALRRDPGFLTASIEYTAARRLVGSDWLERHYFADPNPAAGSTECAMVQGACFALKKRWFERVGGFDADRFFLYWEETDFCRRVRAAGGRVLYCRSLVCRHLGGGSLEGGEQDVDRFWRGFYAYHRKHNGAFRAHLLRAALIVGMSVEYSILSMLGFLRGGRCPDLTRDRRRLRRRLGAQW